MGVLRCESDALEVEVSEDILEVETLEAKGVEMVSAEAVEQVERAIFSWRVGRLNGSPVSGVLKEGLGELTQLLSPLRRSTGNWSSFVRQ